MPVVSVCIITYNRESYLKEAIDSVISQTFSDWELIIVDNGSSDNSVDGIIKPYASKDSRIRLFLNNDNRIAYSRNFALSKCSGKYVAILDSDDVWMDINKLEEQSRFLENHTDYVLLGGLGIMIDNKGNEKGKLTRLIEDADIRKKMLSYDNFIHSSVMFVREKVLNCGGYDESLSIADDYELWLRLGCVGKFANLSKEIVKYRIHNNNASLGSIIKLFKINVESAKIIKKYKKYYPDYFYSIVKLYYSFLKSLFELFLFKLKKVLFKFNEK